MVRESIRSISVRTICLFLIVLAFFPTIATAASSYKIGNATVTASFVSHRGTSSCKDLPVGSGKHYCCWNYAYDAYKKIWVQNFSRNNSNNLLRDVAAADRKMTAANLAKYFAEAKPGAMFRMDKDSVETNGDNNGHSMIFLELGSNGAWFWEGNCDGKGSTRIKFWTWSDLENKYGVSSSKKYNYIKYIIWPGAHAYREFTVVDSMPRIAISTKSSTSSDKCRLQSSPYDQDQYHLKNIEKGAIVYISGAVKNKHGNTWYKIVDAKDNHLGYIWEGDLKITEGNATVTKKADVNLLGVVKTKDGHLKEKPYEAAYHGSTIAKGKTVTIVASYTNSHGNLWYKTSDGYYIYSSDVTTYSCTELFRLEATFKNLEKRESHIAPYLDSPAVSAISKGKFVNVTRFVTNSHGNIWAQLEDGSYLCFYDFEDANEKMEFQFSTAVYIDSEITVPEGNLTKGKSYPLRGKFHVLVPMLSVSARITSRDSDDYGKIILEVIAQPSVSTRIVDINSSSGMQNGVNINNKVAFGKLSDGAYHYSLVAQMGFTHKGKTFKFGNENVIVSSDFTVGKVKTVPVEKIVVTNQRSSLAYGEPYDFQWTVYPENATNRSVTWTSSNESVLWLTSGDYADVVYKGCGTTTVTVKANDGSGVAVSFDVTVYNPNQEEEPPLGDVVRIPGDVNDDGKVNSLDAQLTMKYAAKWAVTINLINADVNADGKVNSVDAQLILKYAAKWDVVLR